MDSLPTISTQVTDYDHIIFTTLVLLFAVSGTIGNVLIVVLYIVKKRSFAVRKYILTLSVVDLVINVVVIPYTVLFEFRLVTNDFFCHGMEIVRHTLVGFSNLILLLIAGERLLMVWKPMVQFRTEKMKSVLILCLLAISIISSIPAALIFEVKPHGELEPSANMTIPTNDTQILPVEESNPQFCRYTTSILGRVGSGIYRDFISFMLMSELLLLIVFYIIVYVLLYTHKKKLRNSMSLARSQPRYPRPSTGPEEITTRLSTPDSASVESEPGAEVTTPSIPVSGTPNPNVAPQSVDPHTDRGNRPHRNNRRLRVPTKTWTMMFVCTLIYVLCWIPFCLAIFNVFDILVFRYFFFLGHATNPIVYSILNDKVWEGIKEILRKPMRMCKTFNQRS
uniref:Uncharacterized protein LOC111126037 n=1 Tax=Crassostrea virginica TaxID=6565 RepID=A0A8B8DEJ4_CRAVI|nr:uncharacterized protein LOC111126037 [Crassostrea virginica]